MDTKSQNLDTKHIHNNIYTWTKYPHQRTNWCLLMKLSNSQQNSWVSHDTHEYSTDPTNMHTPHGTTLEKTLTYIIFYFFL